MTTDPAKPTPLYCGNAKIVTFNDGSTLMRVSVSLDRIPAEHITTKDGKRYVNITVQELREPDQYGNTHSVKVDTWKPKPRAAVPPPAKRDVDRTGDRAPAPRERQPGDDDIPNSAMRPPAPDTDDMPF